MQMNTSGGKFVECWLLSKNVAGVLLILLMLLDNECYMILRSSSSYL